MFKEIWFKCNFVHTFFNLTLQLCTCSADVDCIAAVEVVRCLHFKACQFTTQTLDVEHLG